MASRGRIREVRFTHAVAIVLALAGQPEQQPPVQRFKSSVDVVQVDVSAVDGNGRPIADLATEDFELRVDGRRRSIVSVQFVTVPSDSATRQAPDPGHYSSNAQGVGGRLIMIAVDRTSIATGRAKAALEAASRFVGSLNRADRVALATIPEGPQVNFTADHALVQRLLLKIEGTAVASFGTRNIGIADALAFDRRDESAMQRITERECGVPAAANQRSGSPEVMICQGEVKSEALLVTADARVRARQSIEGLQALLEGFPPSQTPKILAYISEGLVTQGEPSPLSWLDARAAAAHVTIYPLHLESSEYDASQRRPPAQPLADRVVKEHGLAMLAQATGGDLFRILSNSDFAFQRLSAELSGYYLLGFEPDERERNGRPHDISVHVRRRGVTVRSRRQFTIGTTSVKTAEAEIVATLRDPLPAIEIPVKFTTYSFRDPRQAKMRLFVAAEIDRSINPGGQISVGYAVVDFDGRLAASQMDSALPAPPPNRQRTEQRYFSQASVDPGKYTVKLVVVDDAGRRGSVERIVEARLNEAGSIRASDLLLGEGADREWGLPVAPAITGDITGGSLHGYIELFADAAEALEQASVTLEIAASETSAALERVPVQLATSTEDVRCRLAPARVDVARLPPGDYVARAVIAVGLDAVGQVSRPFRIAASGAKRNGELARDDAATARHEREHQRREDP
jgi:VWFA-related protein